MKLCTSFFSLSFSEALSAFNLKALPMYRRKNHTHTHTHTRKQPSTQCTVPLVLAKKDVGQWERSRPPSFSVLTGGSTLSHITDLTISVIYCSTGSQIIICNYWGERGKYFCVFSVFTDALFSTGTASDLFNAVPWLFWWKTCW